MVQSSGNAKRVSVRQCAANSHVSLQPIPNFSSNWFVILFTCMYWGRQCVCLLLELLTQFNVL